MKHYIDLWKKGLNFKGRSTRADYWFAILINIVIIVLVGIVLRSIPILHQIYDLLYQIYCVAAFIPFLALIVRRLHDIGKSGLYLLVLFIPIIGGIILLVFACIPSQEFDNLYGPYPYRN